MAEFKTPTSKKFRSRIENNSEYETPIVIPASPYLQQIGYGCGVNVFTLERSPKIGHVRSPWAVKKRNNRIAHHDKKYNERIRLEADILRKLNHPNIIGFRAFTISPTGDPCLVMEQLDNSLGDKIEERQEEGAGPFPPGKILTVAREVANALEYLHHEVHILHGDLKSYNILLSQDWKLVKVCDFGVSVPLTKDLQMNDSKKDVMYTGTKCWNAPEVIFENGPITNKTDIWSYGLVIWEMIATVPPHSEHFDGDETPTSSMDISLLDSSDPQTMDTKENYDPNDLTDESISFLEEKSFGTFGTRPALPAIHIGPEYDQVLEIFIACTDSDYKTRPSAKGLVQFFKNYAKSPTPSSSKSANKET
ncbi:lymphokine-activated killer T-cell-originated protein kinase [Venturia canescens]|uniref:lymphokine-activated killer T-cell-originated protein kinase n=1 Tax=Venturia canescens TaxID=32260 RepID=UPI001C9C2A44|nr:lymphokine-activated killer T-cell-originated protein kinase [Venturia canescens]